MLREEQTSKKTVETRFFIRRDADAEAPERKKPTGFMFYMTLIDPDIEGGHPNSFCTHSLIATYSGLKQQKSDSHLRTVH